jgi:uncharacterized RDD family membrane protein YckC
MLSEKKSLLRISELLAAAGAIAMLVQAARSYAQPAEDYPAFLAAGLCMVGVLLTFLPVCNLGGEYVRTIRKSTTADGQSDGLFGPELAFMVRWAPGFYKLAAWIGVVILVCTLLVFGSITVTTGKPTNPRDIPALYLYFSVFFLVSLPVLGSASRMPGSYAANHGAYVR